MPAGWSLDPRRDQAAMVVAAETLLAIGSARRRWPSSSAPVSCALRRWAPVSCAPRRSQSTSLAVVRSQPMSTDPSNDAPVRLTPRRSALVRLQSSTFACERSALRTLASRRSASRILLEVSFSWPAQKLLPPERTVKTRSRPTAADPAHRPRCGRVQVLPRQHRTAQNNERPTPCRVRLRPRSECTSGPSQLPAAGSPEASPPGSLARLRARP
jgi:hypothetical protein